LFNAHYDEYGFQPIVVFDGGGRFIAAVLRPAKRPKGTEICSFLRRLLRAIRANWPKTEIMPTAIIAAPRFSTGVGAMVSTTFSASHPPRRCASISKCWKPT
jgi:Transposase DDE domain group 1